VGTRQAGIEAGNCWLELDQPLTGPWADQLEQEFRALPDRGIRRVVLNLEGVPLIDGRGLSALVTGLKIFGDEPQNLCLVAPQAQPRLVFELTGFDKIFCIAPTPGQTRSGN